MESTLLTPHKSPLAWRCCELHGMCPRLRLASYISHHLVLCSSWQDVRCSYVTRLCFDAAVARCTACVHGLLLESRLHRTLIFICMVTARALLTRDKRRSRLHAAVARCMAFAHGFVSNHACVTHLSSCTCSQVVSPAWLVSVTRPVQYFCALDISGLALGLKCDRKCFRPKLPVPTSQFISIYAGGVGTVEFDLYRADFGFPGPLYDRPSGPGRPMTTRTAEAIILFDFGVW